MEEPTQLKAFVYQCLLGYSNDIAYNSNRNYAAVMPVKNQTTYHLFAIDVSEKSIGGNKVRLLRRTKWHSNFGGKILLNSLATKKKNSNRP